MKPVILFVDDEVAVLDGLCRQLRRQRELWDLRFASSGREALELLAAGPVDVVVTDVRMPDVDGLTLLRTARARHPEVARMVLSGYCEPAEERQVYQVAHRVLPKPCEHKRLVEALEQAVGMRALVSDPVVRALVGGIERLPAVPQVYTQLMSVLDDDRSDAQAVARIIERDSVLVASVLRGANSAAFGVVEPVTRVRDAVAYLGRRLISSMVLGVAMLDRFREAGVPPAFLRLFQARAMATANVAMRIADRKERDDAYAAGMLHDIGQLVLFVTFGEGYQILLGSDDPVVAEVAALGASHDQVGAYLLGLWGVPVAVVAAVAGHHAPLDADATNLSRAMRIAPPLVAASQASLAYAASLVETWSLTPAERARAQAWLSDASPRATAPASVASRPVTYRAQRGPDGVPQGPRR